MVPATPDGTYIIILLYLICIDSIEGVWYPKEKIRQAKRKLLGCNPANVMLTELTLGHEKSQEFPGLKKILMGDKIYNKRAQVCFEFQAN